MSRIRWRWRIDGWKETRRGLDSVELFGDALRERLHKATDILAAAIWPRIPRKSGRLAQKLHTGVDKRPLPRWAAVRVGTISRATRSGKRFRYGFALSYSRSRVFRYQSGPLAGRPTFGWFQESVKRGRAMAFGALEGLRDQIESRWQTLSR